MIAHRLLAICNPDKIVMMTNGGVVEEGDHNSLMRTEGTYSNLVKLQNLRQIKDEELILERKGMIKLVPFLFRQMINYLSKNKED